jgi:antirestriction protein ArdC
VSALLSADLDLTAEPRADHASYLDHWLKVLKADRRAIFTAASHAQRAADYLNAPREVIDGQQRITTAREFLDDLVRTGSART